MEEKDERRFQKSIMWELSLLSKSQKDNLMLVEARCQV